MRWLACTITPAAGHAAFVALRAAPARSWGLLVLLAAFAGACLGQGQEQADLEKALSEAGASPLEYLRAIEKHLQQYPNSPRRAELERAATRAAIEAHDDQRIIEYGERVLARQADDLQVLEQVTRALLEGGSKETWERALKYARRYEELVRQMQRDRSGAQWRNETDRGLGRALCDEARASGNLGRLEEALALAQRAFET